MDLRNSDSWVMSQPGKGDGVGKNAIESVCYVADMPAFEIPRSIDELRSLLAGRIGVSPDEVTEDASLFELGFDSVTVIALASAWRRAGLACPTQEFVDAPTLGDWWRLIQRAA